MPMTLEGPSETFHCTVFDWGALLDIAVEFGWLPLGTVVDAEELKDFPGGVWDGNYQTNDMQRVLESDAAELADALERALKHISERDLLNDIRVAGVGLPGRVAQIRLSGPHQ
jgi:hypothetical protein